MSAASSISAAMNTPTTKAARISSLVMTMRSAVDGARWIDALRNADAIAALFTDLIADCAQEAYNDGATKRAIADALGVTPATFRGMERTR